MKNTLRVRLNNTWLDQLGFGVGAPTYSTVFGHPGGSGPDEASVSLAAPIGYRHRDLYEGAWMRVYSGATPVFGGHVGEIDRDQWVIRGRGWHRMAADAVNFQTGYTLTAVPDDAIDFGISRGALAAWSRPASLRATAVGAAVSLERPSTVAALLDAAQKAAPGLFWNVDVHGRVSMRAASTAPDYHMVPKSIDLPVSYDDYASAIFVRFLNSATSLYATVGTVSPDGASERYYKEHVFDALDLGAITSAEAFNIVDSVFGAGKAKPGYTASVETTGWQLLNKRLRPADPRLVTAGQVVRLHGVGYPGPQTYARNYDFTIGRTVYTGGQDTVLIDPVNLVANGSLEDTIARVLGAAWDVKFGGA